MKNSKDLLIVERSSSALTVDKNENKDYVLEGIFGQIDQKNRNNRIYTEDEYVPQIEALQAKIKSSKLLGELDHPTQFDTSLKNVSHIVEELYYDKDTKEVRGKIRLLDTDAGRQAKALVDAGVPLQTAPVSLSLNTFGCPAINYGQSFFVDFGTGTTIDNVFVVTGIDHSISQGKFETKVKMTQIDAFGKYTSTLTTLTKTLAALKDAGSESTTE